MIPQPGQSPVGASPQLPNGPQFDAVNVGPSGAPVIAGSAALLFFSSAGSGLYAADTAGQRLPVDVGPSIKGLGLQVSGAGSGVSASGVVAGASGVVLVLSGVRVSFDNFPDSPAPLLQLIDTVTSGVIDSFYCNATQYFPLGAQGLNLPAGHGFQLVWGPCALSVNRKATAYYSPT